MSDELINQLNEITRVSLADPLTVRMDDWNAMLGRVTKVLAKLEQAQARVAELSEALQVAVDTPELGGGTWYDMAVAALAERAGGNQ